MTKTILITGATDGIGLETAKLLAAVGHRILLHGRSASKMRTAVDAVSSSGGDKIESYLADLSRLEEVEKLAQQIAAKHDHLDVLINNAGVLKAPNPITKEGFDIRFVVNTFAPVLLSRRLLKLMDKTGRIVNVSSAGQSRVQIPALKGVKGKTNLPDMEAYTQSKLAVTMFSIQFAAEQKKANGPEVIAVNPGSMLASKMVKESFGVTGNDIGVGANILFRAAVADEFADASGKYFDNDSERFANPNADALDATRRRQVMEAIDEVLESHSP